jgi:3-oxoacyl-[acyl-carrier-protein] synthase II
MAQSERRVVISGLGLLSPLGVGADPFWAGLSTGRSAIRAIQSFVVDGLPCHAGGEVPAFDIRTLALPKHRKALTKSLKYMARDIQLAVAAAELAMADSGLADGGVDPTRIGLDLGAGLISSELDELAPAIKIASKSNSFDFSVYGREGIPAITPIWLLKYLPNMLACHISILSDLQGPSNSITEGESASALAIGEACRIIQRGRADVMVTGGADSKIHPLSMVRMALLDSISRWEGDPTQACRPFDKHRDGWVPGEGAAILIIEEREHALARGAKILGELLGFGSGCDANPGGGLDPEGVGTEIAIQAALKDAGIEPGAVGHVNAHGAATLISDRAEARAFARVFGPNGVPVTALKGYFGNIASGGSAVELVGSLLGVNHGRIPQTAHCDELDTALQADVVVGASRPIDNPIFVKTSVTRHGQAAALVVRGEPG